MPSERYPSIPIPPPPAPVDVPPATLRLDDRKFRLEIQQLNKIPIPSRCGRLEVSVGGTFWTHPRSVTSVEGESVLLVLLCFRASSSCVCFLSFFCPYIPGKCQSDRRHQSLAFKTCFSR